MATNFALSSEDLTRFHKLIAKRFRRSSGVFSFGFLSRVLVWFGLGIAGAVFMRLWREYPEIASELKLIGGALAMTMIAVAAMPFFAQAHMRKRMLSPDGAFLASQTLEMTDDALVVRSKLATSNMRWASMLFIDQDEWNCYLFVDHMQAIIIPKSVVATLGEEFVRHTSHLKHQA
jgi:hypothetical protein